MRPLAPKSGRVSVLLGILTIWGVSGLLAAPAGYYSMLLPISRWRTCEHKPTTDIVLCKSTTLYFFYIVIEEVASYILDAALPISKFDVV